MTSDAQIKQIFKFHPSISELFQDENGNVWVEKSTAENQSKGGKITVLKRSKFLTNKVKKV